VRAATADLADLSPGDVSVVMFGSWARRELTDGSDNDWAILTPEGREHDDDVYERAPCAISAGRRSWSDIWNTA